MKFRTTARKKARKRQSCPANDPKYKYAIMVAPEQQEAVPFPFFRATAVF